MTYIDDYTIIQRTPNGVYEVTDICIGAARGGSCRCVSHDRYTVRALLSVVEAARQFGAAVVRDCIAESRQSRERPKVRY